MKISIVSPSFNQAQFISRTIESVAEQNYANKEHIIVDGMSVDGSVEIIRKAESTYDHVRAIIEADRGQADAINKGFRVCSGDIIAWINTDDFYNDPSVLQRVVGWFEKHADADIIYGRGWRLNSSGERIREAWINRDIRTEWDFWKSLGILQPSVFFRKHVFEAVGGLDDQYVLQLDYEYWIRLARAGFKFQFVDDVFSSAVVHADAKSTRDRLAQLSECIAMIENHYHEVPKEWFDRLADFSVTSIDQKTRTSEEAESSEIVREKIKSISDFLQVSYRATPGPRASRERIILTAFDSEYFMQGLNLVASLHRTSLASFDEIVVFSLSLTPKEKALLNKLQKVRVTDLPPPPPGFPDFNDPKGRAYKSAIIACEGLDISDGASVLWLDAGLSFMKDIDDIFDLIEESGFFITDHSDSRHWPFYNIHFTHSQAIRSIRATTAELMAPHMCSAIVGYVKGGPYQNLIEEARRFGRRREMIMWPKVLDKPDANRGSAKSKRDMEELRKKALDGLMKPEEVEKSFPYYGHRTQSIYSILCHRFNAPTYPSSIYRQGNDASTAASKRNWKSSAKETDQFATSFTPEGLSAEHYSFHHRGTYTNLSGLLFERSNEPAFVVGNGPSLRDFDFEKLRGRVWVGMNAAYRFWEKAGIFPHIYACLDTVVQDSHKEEIRDLVERRDELGIRFFFLRKSFEDFWPDSRDVPGVFFLEDLQVHAPILDRDKITTGSFSVYFCAFLGHTDIKLLGIDLNYVEKIDEAEVQGRELVIKEDIQSNPNYFFDEYQKIGDRYNPPNRHEGMHLRSWNECWEVMQSLGISVTNGNLNSAVECFPKLAWRKIFDELESPMYKALRRIRFFGQMSQRQEVFRNAFLERNGSPPEVVSFSEDQLRRLALLMSSAPREKLSPEPLSNADDLILRARLIANLSKMLVSPQDGLRELRTDRSLLARFEKIIENGGAVAAHYRKVLAWAEAREKSEQT